VPIHLGPYRWPFTTDTANTGLLPPRQLIGVFFRLTGGGLIGVR
jgi:hypothetical protein